MPNVLGLFAIQLLAFFFFKYETPMSFLLLKGFFLKKKTNRKTTYQFYSTDLIYGMNAAEISHCQLYGKCVVLLHTSLKDICSGKYFRSLSVHNSKQSYFLRERTSGVCEPIKKNTSLVDKIK